MATSDEPDAAPDAIRSRAREAVGRAWEAAVRAGALPALPDDAARPAIGIERPANAAFGDLATNLAMQLARPLRKPPLEIAEAIAAALRDGPDGDLVASAEVARPGFVNLRVADAAYEATVDRDPRRPGGLGPFPARVAAQRRRRVRVGEPDGAAPHRQRARRLRRRPPEPRPRGRRAGGDARVLLQRLRRPGAQARRVRARDAERGAGPRRRLPRRLRRGPRGGGARTTSDRAAAAPGADGAEILGRWASERVRAGIEASIERLGVHFDVWTSEGSLHRDGWVDQAIERLMGGGHAYEQDGALWFRSTDLRRRQGPRADPVDRGAHLLRG